MHTELSLIIRAGGFWLVNDELGKLEGWLRAKVESEVDQPPVKGWQYHDGDGDWLPDITLECSREVSEGCKEIVLEMQGEAVEKHPHCAGNYVPLKGKMNRGRWVGSCQQHSFCIKTIVMDATITYLYMTTRSLGVLQALTSSWRPLDFVLCALRALRPCDPCHNDWIVCWPLDSVLAVG